VICFVLTSIYPVLHQHHKSGKAEIHLAAYAIKTTLNCGRSGPVGLQWH